MTVVCKYVLIDCNCKIILNVLYLVIIYVAVVTIYSYMIHNKDNTQKFGWSLSMYDTGVRDSWRVGQQGLFLMNRSLKLTYWPTDQPIGQKVTYSPSLTHWPIG